MAGRGLAWQHQKALEPFREMLNGFRDRVIHLSEGDLATLGRAVESCTMTNCGWDTFEAALLMKPVVAAERRRRRL